MSEIYVNGKAARKIARISALWPDSEIVIIDEADGEPLEEALYVHVLDEYSTSIVRRFVVRENGWSNPSISRAKAELKTR